MAFYAVLLDSTKTNVVIMKATSDPTVDGNWSSVESHSNRLIISMWAHVEGTDIYIVTQEDNQRIRYSRFATSTDTWTTNREFVLNQANPFNGNNRSAVSISVRSDGDIIILYTGNDGTDDQVLYARREATVWTVDVQVDNGGVDDWIAGVIVRGSSDRMHFFFKNDGLNDAYQRTLTSANVLETFPSAGDTSASTTANSVFGPGVSYDDGGTQRVRCPYRDSTNQVSYAEFDSVDAPGAFTINPNISDDDAFAANSSLTACLAVDGTDEHLLYSGGAGGGLDQDVWHDKNDGVDTEIFDAVTANRISSNVYDRTTNTRLAFIWDDGGTVKYNEVNLGALGVAVPIAYYHHIHHNWA